MSCSLKTLSLSVGESKTLKLRLQMAKGWHVNANDPQSEYAVPLNIAVLGGGVSISVDWPHAEPITSAGESVQVFGGIVEIQGSAEGNRFSRKMVDQVLDAGVEAISTLFELQIKALE